jgi:hypothetical protein
VDFKNQGEDGRPGKPSALPNWQLLKGSAHEALRGRAKVFQGEKVDGQAETREAMWGHRQGAVR